MNFKQANAGNFRVGRAKALAYLVVHYTANNGDTAAGNASYFAREKVGASAHYFVDEKEVWQAVKDSDTAFHCETKGMAFKCSCRNANSIGVELCSRKDGSGRYYFKEETVKNAAELVKKLMEVHKIPQSNVIRHFDVCGKNCPAPLLEHEKWQNFKKRLVETEMEKKIKIALNGKEKTVTAIEKDGYNYVKLQDLRDEKIEVGYENNLPTVRVK